MQPAKMLRPALFLLSLIVGATFLFAAWTKLNAPELTEYMMVDYLGLPWLSAAVLSRVLIGVEAGVGMMLLISFHGPAKFVLKLSLALLFVFTLYLIRLWFFFGNHLNCGCFGDSFFMSPAQALLKNGFIVAALIVLFLYQKGWQVPRALLWFAIVLGVCVSLPFIAAPVSKGKPIDLTSKSQPINLVPIYDTANQIIPKEDLRQGKHILAFLSPNCQHCRMTAYKMHLLKKQHPDYPFFLIIGGTRSDLADFWKETKAANLPWSRLESITFYQYTGGSFPMILLLNSGLVEARCNYNELDAVSIDHWLKLQDFQKNGTFSAH